MAPTAPIFLVLVVVLPFSNFVVRPSAAACLPRNNTHLYVIPSLSSSTSSSSPSSSSSPKLQPSPTPPQTHTPPPQSPPPEAPPSHETPSGSAPPSGDTEASSIFSFIPKITGTVPPSLQGICKQTTYPDLCLSSINPLLSGKPITGSYSLSSALELQIKATKQQTQATMADFTKLAHAAGTSPDVATTLQDCQEKFSDAIDNYDTALAALAENDIPTVEIDLSAVLDDFDTCSGGDAPGDAPVPGTGQPWVDKAYVLRNLTDNCLDLAIMLK